MACLVLVSALVSAFVSSVQAQEVQIQASDGGSALFVLVVGVVLLGLLGVVCMRTAGHYAFISRAADTRKEQ